MKNKRLSLGPAEPKPEAYRLRLFITGATPCSTRALLNLRAVCEEHLLGRYSLEVIDIYQQPRLAKDEQILAAPTLIKELPAPPRRLIGDMSRTDKVLLGLDIKPSIVETDEIQNIDVPDEKPRF